MRTLLAALFFTCSIEANAQHLLNDGTYLSKDSLLFKIGEKITIGNGTLEDGDFKYIYMNEDKWYIAPSITGEHTPLPSSSSGYNATIVKIKKIGNDKMGYKYFLTLSLSKNVDNYMVDIEPALRTGEVVKDGSHQ
jgi:hypothetical protein